MIQAASQTMNLDEFLDWYPDGYGRFELHDGVVVEMQPTGTHEEVAGFLVLKQGVEIERLTLSYFIPRQCIIKPIDSDKSGFVPDVAVLDRNALDAEPMWKKRSTITKGETVRSQFRVNDLIESTLFPELKLAAEQIFKIGQ